MPSPARREALRGSLRRANLAWVVIVAVIAALALGVVWKARESDRDAALALQSAAEARLQAARAEAGLWNARLAEARAVRSAGGPGARTVARSLLEQLAAAPSLDPTQRLALRTEAIAQLALIDFSPPESWVTQRVVFRQTWDRSLRRFAQSFGTNRVDLREHPSGRILQTLVAPDGMTRDEARFSPDGQFFACVFQKPPTVLCWRIADGALVLSNRTTSVSYSEVPIFTPDSRQLAIATRQGWELHPLPTADASGPADASPPPDPAPARVRLPRHPLATFSPDSRWWASAQGSNAEIRAVTDGTLAARTGTDFRIGTLDWHPDGTRLALAGQDGRLVFWELPLPLGTPLGTPLAISPAVRTNPGTTGDADGRPDLARAGAPSPELPGAPDVATVPAGRLMPLDGHAGAVVGAWFSPDGAFVLSQSWDSFSSVWDVRTRRRLLAESRMSLEGFSGDGRRVFAMTEAGARQGPATFDARVGFRSLLLTGRRPRFPSGGNASPDGRFYATDHVERSSIWDLATGRELARCFGRSPVFAPDSRAVYTITNNALLRWDLEPATALAGPPTAEPVWLQSVEVLHRDRARNEQFNAVTLAPDARTLVVSATEGGVLLVDRLEPRTRPVRRLAAPAHFASLSADGQWVVAQMHNRQAWLVPLDGNGRKVLLGYHLNTAFSPDGSVLGVTTEKQLVLFERDPSSTNGWKRRVRVPLNIGAGEPPALAFSPDGTTVALPFNRYDLRLHDTTDGHVLATFSPPDPVQIGGKETIGFSPDGERLRALRNDGELIEWNLPAIRAELAQLGLDWSSPPKTKAPATPTPTPTSPSTLLAKSGSATASGLRPGSGVVPGKAPAAGSAGADGTGRGASGWSGPPIAAAAAGLLALVAGAVLFLHQRRIVAAYARAEALAEARQSMLARAQEALFQSQKMEALGTLAAGVAHDFNNLLSIIRLSNQLAARALKPEGATRENMDAIERAVKQGKAIVDSMLGYSRRPVETTGEIEVPKTIRDTVALLSRQFLSGLQLELDLPSDGPPAHGSPARLEQALLNLILNAAEAMGGSGTLFLSAHTRPAPAAPAPFRTPADAAADPETTVVLLPRPAASHIIIAVRDSGPGIPADILPRIFEPFFTTKNAAGHRGTGLGLSLVYTIARQDGWGLEVRSRPGHGATFQLVLPTATATASSTATATPLSAATAKPGAPGSGEPERPALEPDGGENPDGRRLPTPRPSPPSDTVPGPNMP